MTGAYEGPIHTVARVVAENAGITVAQLMSRRNSRAYAWPRQMAMALAGELVPSATTGTIAATFDNRDRTTALYSIHRVHERRSSDADVAAEWDRCRRLSEAALAVRHPHLLRLAPPRAEAMGLAHILGRAYTRHLTDWARRDPDGFIAWFAKPLGVAATSATDD